ncbi:tRNA pseudouridine(38-40) synthase TruA [Huintestinicola sp.]|uniref:tRNA pseudouridine(38-40) synthase TruA n=1 Tax=Huintestinicola sp. TaxID=2981661 RepID=UPI003D7D0225
MSVRNIKVKIAYNGAAYHGFQRQENALSVQNVLEDRLSRLTASEVKINGCSRTDTGVHANEYFFSFLTEHSIPCNNIIRGMNSLLPADIAVLDCEEVPADFHARYSCKGKEYIYKILNRSVRDPFLENLALHYPYELDVDKMNRAGKYIEGTHDFLCFCGALGVKENTVRTVSLCEVKREGDIVILTVRGDGFLYNMVRIIAGTLIYVSEGRISIEDIPKIIESRDRNLAGVTAKPCGLYLNRVFYD